MMKCLFFTSRGAADSAWGLYLNPKRCVWKAATSSPRGLP